MADKVKILIEGVEREVDPGRNVLQVILDEGLVIPHFCYHEALGAVGSCRLCACQIAPAADKPARLEMSCMVRPTEGMIVTVNEAYAKNFRRQVIEDLMLNHPHDCPVCDEGGECMLQDMRFSASTSIAATGSRNARGSINTLGPPFIMK